MLCVVIHIYIYMDVLKYPPSSLGTGWGVYRDIRLHLTGTFHEQLFTPYRDISGSPISE